MKDKEIDKWIDQALREERELPEGLSERLENYIDRLTKEEEEKQPVFTKRKRFLFTISSIAAAILLGVAIFFQTENRQTKPTMVDTFSDPKEAALVAQEALILLSGNFNKGLAQIAEAKQEVEKVNEIINNQLK